MPRSRELASAALLILSLGLGPVPAWHASTGPPGRLQHSMAYELARQVGRP